MVRGEFRPSGGDFRGMGSTDPMPCGKERRAAGGSSKREILEISKFAALIAPQSSQARAGAHFTDAPCKADGAVGRIAKRRFDTFRFQLSRYSSTSEVKNAHRSKTVKTPIHDQ
jgi:hypothetical protein